MTEGRSRLGRIGLAAALAAPLAASPFAARALADRIARFAGEEVAAFSAALAPGDALDGARAEIRGLEREGGRDQAWGEGAVEAAQSMGEAGVDGLSAEGEPVAPEDARTAASAHAEDARLRPRARSEQSAKEHGSGAPSRGLLVRAATVERAVRSGARPDGAPVPASGMRPAGVALYGVGGFGAGLRDGDVVTAVGGAVTTSVGMVIAAVAGAVRSGAKGVSAVVWRDQEKLNVTVEIPAPARPRRSALER